MNDGSSPQADLPARFSPLEHRLVRIAMVAVAGAALAVVIALAVWALAALIYAFRAMLLPMAIAGVIALVLYPLTEGMSRRLHLPRALLAGLAVAILIVGLLAGTWFLVPKLINQFADLYAELVSYFGPAYDRVIARFPVAQEFLQSRIEDTDFGALLPTFDDIFERLGSYVSVLIGLAFMPLFLFFFLILGPRLEGWVTEVTALLSTDVQEEIRYLVKIFVEYVATFFRGQMVIALIMGLMYWAGFSLIGLPAALVLGLSSGLLNIVPFLGTAIGLLVILPYAWLQEGGGLELMTMALAVFVAVQIIESWLLTPKIMSDRSGLHPLMVIISLFFWGTVLGGIIGLLLAVPLSAFVAALWHQIRFRYARQVVSEEGHRSSAEEAAEGDEGNTIISTE